MTTLLVIGRPQTLTNGVIYALPARRTLIRVQQSGGTIEVSNDGTTFAAVTLGTNLDFETAAAFIKAVTTNAIITLKN